MLALGIVLAAGVLPNSKASAQTQPTCENTCENTFVWCERNPLILYEVCKMRGAYIPARVEACYEEFMVKSDEVAYCESNYSACLYSCNPEQAPTPAP